MKKIKLLLILLIFLAKAKAQDHLKKAALDTSAFKKWARVICESVNVSDNGRFLAYPIIKGSYDDVTLILQSFNGLKMEIKGVRNALFTKDSRKIIFKKERSDSLCILELGTKKTHYIAGVSFFDLFKCGGEEWLIYQFETGNRQLLLTNLSSGVVNRFDDVSNYKLSNWGNTLLLARNITEVSKPVTRVSVFDLASGKELLIWQGEKPNNFVFDDSGRKLSFLADESSNKYQKKENRKLLWFYQQGYEKATLMLNDKLAALASDLQLSVIEQFSADGQRLFFKAKEPALVEASPNAIKVDVWSYLDAKLQSQQLAELKYSLSGREYLHVLSVNENRISRLQQKNENVTILKGKKGEIAFCNSFKADVDPYEPWNELSQSFNQLLFTNSGKRIDIELRLANSNPSVLSPNGKYLLLMDKKEKDLYCYALSTDHISNLTAALPIPQGYNDKPSGDNYYENRCLKVAAWMKNGQDLLLYDEYDIWRLDPSGKREAICITNGYGRKHKMEFRLLDEQNSYTENIKLIDFAEPLLLSAFDHVSKFNGFYKLNIGQKCTLIELSMSPNIFFAPTSNEGSSLRPIKVRGTDKWIVSKQSAYASPNLFYTTDFKSFTAISDIYP